MGSAPRPRWQQATALVSLGAGGAVTGLSFVPGSPADVTSPAKLPFALMALEKSTQVAPSSDAVLRSAIVHVAKHFLRMAEQKSPAEMEATIWRHASLDGADHGPSCAAFASLTLELGSHVAGHESWVTGGTSYPWPLHAWAEPRVDPNPASPNVLSVVQDAQNHHRWHPIGDGYTPQPGDWVLFDGHVEVVTSYTGGVLYTIGGDSLPNYSVNAHSYPGPLSGQGVAGFVDNGLQPAAAAPSANRAAPAISHNGPARRAQGRQAAPKPSSAPPAPAAAAPNQASTAAQSPVAPVTSSVVYAPKAQLAPQIGPEWSFVRSRFLAESQAAATPTSAAGQQAAARAGAQAIATVAPTAPKPQGQRRGQGVAAGSAGQPTHLVQGRRSGKADIPGTEMRPAPAAPRARPGQAEIPGLLKRAPRPGASRRQLAPYQRHQHAPTAQPTAPGSPVQRAFIEQVAPGAMATQQKYGVPASVTIAQAIDESAWGQSILATQDHNLFGIKGTGPAGTDLQPTQEFAGGQLVDTTAPFRVYNDIAQSIDAHGKLLARSDYFTNAMANRNQPNAFAAALTGVYATDPSYGIKLIQLMRQYNLYRFDAAATAHRTSPAAHGQAAIPGVTGTSSPAGSRSASPSAAQTASGQAATAHVKLAPGGATNAVPALGGRQGGQGRASRRGSNQAAGMRRGIAGQDQRAAAVDAGWAPDSAIPGTGYQVPAAADSNGGTDQAAMRGQADIPGLPGTAEAPNTHRSHRARSGPRLRPAHPPAGGSAGRSQPVRAAAAAVGHQGSSPRPAKPERAVPGPAASGPASPAPANPVATGPRSTVRHATNPAAPAHPGRQVTSPGVVPVPGLAGSGLGQPTGGSPAQASAGLGDAIIPGLPQAPAAPAATAHARSAVPQYAAVPQLGSVAQDGAWIPGLPGQAAETAGHPQDRNGAGPRGNMAFGAGHGTNLPPTRARRLVAAGHPPAQPGHRAAAAVHDSVPRAERAPARAAAHLPTAPAAPPQAIAPASAPPDRSAITGATKGRPTVGRATATAPASAVAPSATARPAPHSGSRSPGLAPAGRAPTPAPAPGPSPSPAGSAGTAFGSGEPIKARTVAAIRYSHHLPPAVGKAYVNSAKVPLVRGEPLYVDVAGASGIAWEILAACDWMQCKAKPGLSPVYGEKLGTVNPDGTNYRTRSAALERCAYDLVELARTVYHIDLTRSEPLSVRELANAFAAFRWGGLLKEHHTSAMEFPYSVAGLTTQHMHMRWPNIDNPQAPDRPGARFHQPFGAVPVVLSLSYPATA